MVIFLILFFSFTSKIFAEDIKDIKPPIFFPKNYFLLFTVAGLVALVALFLIIRILMKKFKKKKLPPAQPLKSAHQLAYEKLKKLQQKNLPKLGKIKEYYIQLSNIIRCYLEARFLIRAPEMTTEEFLFNLRSSTNLSGKDKNLLKEFLEHCDKVKFARYGPMIEEINKSFDIAWHFIDKTKITDIEP